MRFAAAPDADDEVHRHEHDFPEDVEEEEVESQEHAQHAHLEHEEGDHVLLHARAWMGPKLATMLMSVSSVVSSTSTSEMPSTPTRYWMPKKPIQSTSWTSWKPGRSRRRRAPRTRR